MSRRRLGRYNEFLRFSTCRAYLDRFRHFYLSVALGDILGRSTCRPRVFCVSSAPLKQHFNKRCRISKSLYTSFLVMLFLLFLYYLLQGPSTDAGPIPTIEHRSLKGNHCNDLTHCRTIWNIIWSCLVTIFSCTWVAVHPNVPCPKKQIGRASCRERVLVAV